MQNKNKSIEVSKEHFTIAFNNWIRFTGNMNSNGRDSFASFLGVTRVHMLRHGTTYSLGKAQTLKMRPSAVAKIMLLNSPHWYSILKAREAKRAKQD